jgi:hypothetical protein
MSPRDPALLRMRRQRIAGRCLPQPLTGSMIVRRSSGESPIVPDLPHIPPADLGWGPVAPVYDEHGTATLAALEGPAQAYSVSCWPRRSQETVLGFFAQPLEYAVLYP